MEKRINKKIEGYLTKFKDDLREKVLGINIENHHMLPLIEYIYEYDRLAINKDDLVKRKRIKNSIPNMNRCNAKRADGQQCTRRRKDNCEFCGTHVKGRPHGLITNEIIETDINKKLDVYAQEINGVVYYLDKFNNVYKTEDIMKNIINPKIIGKYERQQDSYVLSGFI